MMCTKILRRAEAGLQVGDELLAIDDTALTDVQLSDLVSMIKSEDGGFSITVYRPVRQKGSHLTDHAW